MQNSLVFSLSTEYNTVLEIQLLSEESLSYMQGSQISQKGSLAKQNKDFEGGETGDSS